MYEGLLSASCFEFLVEPDIRSQTVGHMPLNAL